jgi:Skp family chaperone for outer membrane proteins
MSQRYVTLGFIIASLMIRSLAQGATNQNPDAQQPKVAKVNLQQIIVDSREGKKALNAVTQRFGPQKAELERQQDELDDMKQKLFAAGSTLSEKKRQKREADIENKEKALRSKLEAFQQESEKASKDIVLRIGEKVLKAVQNYANANDFVIVVDNSSQHEALLWASAAVIRARGLEGKSADVLEKELLGAYTAADKVDITKKLVEVVDNL